MVGLFFMLFVIVFIAHLFLTIYHVGNGILRIKCGFFFDRTIQINTIKEIKETRNPVSAPATSLDRLIITYNRYDTVLISPKAEKAFIDQLVQINPLIRVTLTEITKKA